MTAPRPRPRVLIVDDSPSVLAAMQRLLEPYLNVMVADGASGALHALTPDTALVLTDVRMPEVDGLQLARHLREAKPDLPVLFMTGIVEDSLRAQAKALGVKDVLRKPLRAEVLLPTLRELLGEGLPEPAPEAAPASAAPEPAPPTPVPLPTLFAAQPPPQLQPLPVADPLQDVLAALRLLPGVLLAAAFDAQGQPLAGADHLPAPVGGMVRFLAGTAGVLGTHLNAGGATRALQLEFGEGVLVIAPMPCGFLTVHTRDTPGASSVKAWLRSHVQGPAPRALH